MMMKVSSMINPIHNPQSSNFKLRLYCEIKFDFIVMWFYSHMRHTFLLSYTVFDSEHGLTSVIHRWVRRWKKYFLLLYFSKSVILQKL